MQNARSADKLGMNNNVVESRSNSKRSIMSRFVEFIEKRFFKRTAVSIPVSFSIAASQSGRHITTFHACRMTDVSRKGCRLLVDKLTFDNFYLMKCLDASGDYKIVIRVGNKTEEGANIDLVGVIVWLDPVFEKNIHRFTIGVELASVSNIKALLAAAKNKKTSGEQASD